eukprot:9149074-Karenia_brevis.AAC.1
MLKLGTVLTKFGDKLDGIDDAFRSKVDKIRDKFNEACIEATDAADGARKEDKEKFMKLIRDYN